MYYHKNCIVCNAETTAEPATIHPFFCKTVFGIESLPDIQLLTCKECGLKFYNLRPDDIEINRYYKEWRSEWYQRERQKYDPYYTVEFQNTVGQAPQELKARMAAMSRIIGPVLGDIESVLDYGGSDGYNYPPEIKNKIFKVYNHTETLKGKFVDIYHKNDLVSATHVLEHVGDPVEFLKQISFYSQKYIYIEVPNEHTGDIMYEHLTMFTLPSLCGTFKRAGLEVVTAEQVDIPDGVNLKSILCVLGVAK